MRGRLCGAVLVCLALSLVTTQGKQARSAGGQFVDGEIIVKFRATTTATQRTAIISGRASGLIRRFDAVGLHRLRLRGGQSVDAALASFRAMPEVALAQPNYIRRALIAPPNDPFWSIGFQWGPEKIQAPEVWETYTTGDPGVVVASIDTGVDYTHPDLAANMWHNPGEIADNGVDDDDNGYIDDVFGIDTVNGDSDPMDDQGHGTQTAGIMSAVGNNSTGGVGVSWNTKILTCKFVDNTGSGTDADAIECFNYLIALKQRGVNIRVSNNSWGSPREDPPAAALKDAIDAAGAAGILNVFAAGNDGTNNDVLPFDPASFASPSIISVAASDQADNRAAFSNYGASSVHLAAPGVFILTTVPGSYGFADGTSMAAPFVAAAAAMLLANDSSLSVDQLKARILTSVDVLSQWGSSVSSGGRLNLLNAIAFGGNAPPSVALTSPAAGTPFVAPASVALAATATDSDGTIAKVDFYANGLLVGTDTTGPGPYTAVWPDAATGSYSLTAVATDDGGASRTSSPVTIAVSPPPGRINVALAANGAVASVSSAYDANHGASGVINGDRKGLNWGSNGGWNDGTSNTWPDWLEVEFSGSQTIDEIDVFTVQDSYQAPSDPTAAMTFTKYGVRSFTVQYWTGSAWQTVPGGTVTSNTLVWRQFNFAPITTSRIRVHVTQGLASHSRLTEVEAYATSLSGSSPPAVALTSPADGAEFAAPATISFAATATDTDGIEKVDFYANGALVGTDTTGPSPYTFSWANVPTGTYVLTAVATDTVGATKLSTPVEVTVAAPAGRVNLALASNGAVASVSSAYSASYGASGVINGDRKGQGWGNNGGWNDGTANNWPDWVEVQFNGAQTIDEIDVFTVQDNYQSPVEPTPTMGFTLYGVRDFTVQYFNGTAWQAVPGATVTGNTLVWRRFTFSPLTTTRIRVHITLGQNAHSRLAEVEAYGVPSNNAVPTVALTAPAAGSSFVAPAGIALEASAADSDGTIAKVDFYANGTLVGTDTTGPTPYTFAWTNVPAGTYQLTAVATDDDGASQTSSLVTVTVVPPAARVNVAAAANGGVATASSSYNASFGPSGTINGDRKGQGWGSNGGWNDGTANAWPDWVEVQFSSVQTIDEIDVFTVQNNYQAPIEPTPTMTFSLYGVRDFTVQYWTGTAWQTVPGGTVTGNTLVWRKFVFAPVTTAKIRVHVTSGLSSHSRLTEIEAYASAGTSPLASNSMTPAAGFSRRLFARRAVLLD